MALSEAKKRSNNKWDKENMSVVACKLKKKEAEAFRAKCAAEGKTPNAVLHEFILKYTGD